MGCGSSKQQSDPVPMASRPATARPQSSKRPPSARPPSARPPSARPPSARPRSSARPPSSHRRSSGGRPPSSRSGSRHGGTRPRSVAGRIPPTLDESEATSGEVIHEISTLVTFIEQYALNNYPSSQEIKVRQTIARLVVKDISNGVPTDPQSLQDYLEDQGLSTGQPDSIESLSQICRTAGRVAIRTGNHRAQWDFEWGDNRALFPSVFEGGNLVMGAQYD